MILYIVYFLGYMSHPFFSNSWSIFLSATYIAKVSLNSTPFQALASTCACSACFNLSSLALSLSYTAISQHRTDCTRLLLVLNDSG